MYNCVILSDTDQSQITELFNSTLWSSEQHISQQSHDMTHSSEHFNILHFGLVYSNTPFHNLSFHIYFVLFMIGPQGLNVLVHCIWSLELDRSLIIVFPLPQVWTLVFVVFVPVFPNTIRCLSCVNYWRSFPSKDCFKLWTHSKWDSNLSEWN